MLQRFASCLLLAGCAHAPPPPQPVFVPPVCAVAPAPREPERPLPHASACFRNGRPKAVVLEKKEEFPFCAAIDAAELARVEARLRKEIVVYRKPSKLVVDFGCDALTSSVGEVVLEDGSGHGGTLRIVRFERTPSSVDVHMIASSHYFNAGTVISTARMGTADFDAMVVEARVAVLAKPHLIPLSVPSNGFGLGMSGSFSSNDFHLALALRDEEGHLVARHFTGYESSDAQEAILPMRMATERFEAALGSLAFTKEPAPTDDDKALFVRQFLAAMNGEHPFWWITERYVALAAELGTIDVVPTLVRIAQKKGDASADRTRPVALAAIAALTGWDPRVDERGKPRDLDAAAAAAANECAP